MAPSGPMWIPGFRGFSRGGGAGGGGANSLPLRRHGYDDEDKYGRLTRRRTPQGILRSFLSLRTLKVLLGVVALVLFILWRTYELHIEIQVFSRGWIKKTILPTPPLSSTCFDPKTIASTHYDTSLSQSPSYVQLHSGLSMQLGNDCFNFASTIPRSPLPGMTLPKHTIFHTYWRSDLLPLGDRQISLFDSILATQDRESTSLILWTNSPTTTHLTSLPSLLPLLKRYGSRFSIQSIDKKELAKGTPMEGSDRLEMADKKAWLDGDLVRVLVLWGYGGIWVDMDTILTGRDLRVLGEHEWVTQWDCYDKIYQPLNGAMMHFYRNSPYLCEFLHSMSTSPLPRPGSTDWGSLLYHKIYRRLITSSIPPFQILPYCFTDGHTCRLDNRLPDPFGDLKMEKSWGEGRREELRKKVGDVWSVHLHNRWEKGFPKDGWVSRMILERVEEAVRRYDGRRGVPPPPQGVEGREE